MKRRIEELRAADTSGRNQVPDGLYLARVQRIQFRKFAPKPFYNVMLMIVEPKRWSGGAIASRIYCNRKSLWKFDWFLRDFGYDTSMLEEDEVDERLVIGLLGIVKISNVIYDGMAMIRMDGFAPKERWKELSPTDNLDQRAS